MAKLEDIYDQDEIEFILFCRNASDKQLPYIYEKEKTAKRYKYAKIAMGELLNRGLA